MPLDVTEGVPGGAPPLRVQRFSTGELPPAQQFAAYQAATATVFEVESMTDGTEAGFAAEMTAWRLGPLALRVLSDDGVRYRRCEASARRDMLDHWAVTTYIRGNAKASCAGRSYRAEPGVPILCGLHQPLLGERGPSSLATLFVPRDVLPELAWRLDATAGGPLAGPLAHLLAVQIETLAAHADRLTAREGVAAGAAVLAMLRAVASGSGDAVVVARPHIQATQRMRLLKLIRENLGSVRLDPDRLARMAGMSRTKLYEAFEEAGGVARAIQRERLLAVRRALTDPAERRSIARIAEDFGFPDASVFGRAFRREFGMTAREGREIAALGGGAPEGRGAPPRDLAALLRGLTA